MKKSKLLTALAVLAMSVGTAAGLCACGDENSPADSGNPPANPPAHTHDYGDATYAWTPLQEGGYSCTATKTCTANDDTVTETVTAVAGASTATHTQAGSITYTATFTKNGFSAQTKDVAGTKIPHTFGTPTYVWNATDDGYTCTATVKCTESGCAAEADATVTETVAAVAGSSTATHTEAGNVEYTATFTKKGFSVQTKDVAGVKLPHTFGTPEYDWHSEDGGYTYTCTATKKCTLPACAEVADATVTETVTAAATNEAESDTACGSSVWYHFTATFTDADFTEQTKAELHAYAHNYGAWYITKAPTLTDPGERSHSCARCGDTQKDMETEVPALSNTTEWTKVDAECVTTPTLNAPAYDVYESATYGKVRLETAAKLAAPYDNTEYYQLEYEFGDAEDVNKTINVYSRDNGTSGGPVLTLSGNAATGIMSPFNKCEITVLSEDAATFNGKVQIVAVERNNDGSIKETKTYNGVCDEESGIIVFEYSANSVIILTPFHKTVETTKPDPDNEDETINVQIQVAENNAVGSVFGDHALAVEYAYETGKTLSIFYADGKIYLGVKFVDGKGSETAVAANAAYNSDKLYVYQDTTLIAGFAKKDDVLVATDGHEGAYGDVTLDGIGGATYNSKAYAYTWVGGDSVLFTLIDAEKTEYYEVAPETFAVTQPKVTLTIVSDKSAELGGTAITTYDVVKNVKANLPVLTTADGSALIGWYLDEDFENTANGTIFTEATTVYLRWAKSITVTLHYSDTVSADIATGETITIAELLETDATANAWNFEVGAIDGKYFVGWYTESTFQNSVSTTTGIVAKAGENAVALYAKWADLPAYYGSYTLFDCSGEKTTSKGYQPQTVNIDAYGNITGSKSGTITSYDPAIGKIEWLYGTTNCTFYFDKESGILLGDYDHRLGGSKVDVSELYYGVKGVTEYTADLKHYALRSDTTSVWLMRFFEYNGKIALYYNGILTSDINVTDAFGNALTIDTIPTSKTLVVKNADEEIIVARASTDVSFSGGKATIALDQYFGTYTLADNDDLVIDGAGKFIWGEKSGTYTAVEDKAYGFDMYVVDSGNVVEYYELTLSDDTYTVNKAMVTVTYSVPAGHTAPAAVSVNKNVPMTLASFEETGFVFNGWYATLDGGAYNDLKEDGFVPTGDVTLYGKVDVAAQVTVVYNSEDNVWKDNDVVNSYVGFAYEIENPVSSMKFDGWFTTATYDAGSEWTSGTELTGNLTIYAKWSPAPLYYGKEYMIFAQTSHSNADGTANVDKRTGAFTFSADGVYSKTGGWPMNSAEASLKDLNETTGAMTLTTQSTQLGAGDHIAFMDMTTGLIAVSYEVATDAHPFEGLILFVPGATSSNVSNYKESYWANGNARAITFTVTVDGTPVNYSVLVFDNQVYFNVAFFDAEDNAVAADECKNQTVLVVKDASTSEVKETINIRVSLTAVYGNSVPDKTVNVVAGADIDFSAIRPNYTNGKKLEGWYTDSACTIPFTATSITANTTIYCKWVESDPYDVSTFGGANAWTQTGGVWESGGKGVNSLNSSSVTSALQIEAYADGMLTFSCGASGENNCDYLRIYVNDTVKFDKIGSASDTISFESKTIELNAGDVVKFVFRKDNSANKNLDCAQVKDISFEAKVYEPVTLTYNYNGYETADVTVPMTSWDVVEALQTVDFKNGDAIFMGWYTKDGTGDGWGEKYEAGTVITENTTLYAKWEVRAPYDIANSKTAGNAYGWTYNETDGVWESVCANNMKSTITITAYTDVTVTFSFWASSEHYEKWDYFHVTVNSTKKPEYNAGGDPTNAEHNGYSETWKDATITLHAGDVLVLTYEKDNSTGKGQDKAKLRDLTIAGDVIVAASADPITPIVKAE